MTWFLGCDVAKSKVDTALVDGQGTVLWEDHSTNDSAAWALFLLTLHGAYPDEEIMVLVEATGRYHYPLLAATAVHSPIKVLNPILTKQSIKTSIRGSKTDRTDAILIARLGCRGEGRLYTPEPYMPTKLQTRSYQKLGELSQALRKHTTHLQAMDETVMTKQVVIVFQAVEAALAQARKQLYQELQRSAQGETFRQLQTIPGIGPFVAACLMAEIQDMTRFTRQKQLIAYFGLDPRIRQSGHTLNSTGRLTKRGSPHGRRAIFIAANAARRYDPWLKAYYDRKRAEGKSYTVATCAVARKLLTIVRAVWISNAAYAVSFWEV